MEQSPWMVAWRIALAIGYMPKSRMIAVVPAKFAAPGIRGMYASQRNSQPPLFAACTRRREIRSPGVAVIYASLRNSQPAAFAACTGPRGRRYSRHVRVHVLRITAGILSDRIPKRISRPGALRPRSCARASRPCPPWCASMCNESPPAFYPDRLPTQKPRPDGPKPRPCARPRTMHRAVRIRP